MNGQVCNDPQGTADTSEKDLVRIKLRSESPGNEVGSHAQTVAMCKFVKMRKRQERANARTSALENFYGGQITLETQLITPSNLVIYLPLMRQHSTNLRLHPFLPKLRRIMIRL